jgi:hypothetical protein
MELLEKIFLLLPKNNIDNLGWGTVGVALIVLTSDGRTEGPTQTWSECMVAHGLLLLWYYKKE